MSDFKIAVVMPAFNSEKYISKAIDSVISQSLDFEKHIQIIVVDDKSLDNTAGIVKNYIEKYPSNITLISNAENRGPGYSRNRGLEMVDAEYVNFLDSDDYISQDAFKKAYDFLNENKDIDIASIPIHFFGVVEGPHKLNFKFEKTQVVDLNEHPNHIQLSGPSSFFRYSKLRNYSFSQSLRVSEDPLLINQMLLDNPRIAFLSSPKYHYRKAFTQESLISTSTQNKSYFTTRIDEYFIRLIESSLEKYDHVPKFIQHVLMYDLQWIVEIRFIFDLLDEDERNVLYNKILHIMSFIEDDVVMAQLSLPIELKKHLLLLKRHGWHYLENKDGYQYDDEDLDTIYIDHFEFLAKDVIYVSGIYTDFSKGTEISAIADGKRYQATLKPYYQRDNYSLGFNYAYNHNFEVYLPMCEKISFESERPLKIDYNQTSRLSRTAKYRLGKDYIAIDRFDHIEIVPKTVLRTLGLEIGVQKSIITEKRQGWKTGIVLRVLFFLYYYYFKNRHIWVFQDLPNAAGDNGYYLFKSCDYKDKYFVFAKSKNLKSDLRGMELDYLASPKKDKIKSLLGMSPGNDTYFEIKKLGKVLPYKSLKHRLVMLFADFIITSHPDNDIIYPFWGNYPHVAGLSKSKTVFLQHGVTKDNISYWFNKFDKRIRLILTVSDYEKDAFMTPGYGFDEYQFKTLGFPRFDYLEKLDDKKTIVLMPTWRKQYNLYTLEEFRQTSYFRSYNEILNDNEFTDYLKSKGYRLIFKPHRNILKFLDAFDIPDNIELGVDITYNDIFNHASVLITDFSSVAFDFAYLKKPILYFHPEKDYHFDIDKGYFKYDTMGFGPVAHDYEEFKRHLSGFIENDCEMSDEYALRVDEFFKYHDKNNSKRVLDEIERLSEEFYY